MLDPDEDDDDLDENYEDIDMVDDEDEDEDEEIIGKGKKRVPDADANKPPKKKKLSAVTPGIDEIVDDLNNKKKKGKRGPRSKLPANLARTMGEANIAYMNQEHSRAADLLKEVIKQAPHVAAPYHTLGLIYEAEGDKKNALNFFMIAAHVTPNDALLWKRLAIMSRELGNLTQAIYCYTKAIKLDTDDVDSLWDRSVIYSEQGDTKRAIEGFMLLSERLPENTDVIKELARVHSQSGHPEKAIELLEAKLKSGMDDLNIVNILCELLIGKNDYQKGVDLVTATGRSHGGEAMLPIDLRLNKGICHVYLGNIEAAEQYMDLLMEKDVKVFGDLYLNLAEAYLSVREHQKALKIFQALTESNAYNHPLIWLKQGTCLRALGKTPDAIAIYEAVIEKLPGNVDAMLALTEMYKEQGMASKALLLLEQHRPIAEPEAPSTRQQLVHITSDVPTEIPTSAKDLRVQVEKALILFDLKKYEEFLEVILPVFSIPVPKHVDKRRGRKPSKKPKVVETDSTSFFEISAKKKVRRRDPAATQESTEQSQASSSSQAQAVLSLPSTAQDPTASSSTQPEGSSSALPEASSSASVAQADKHVVASQAEGSQADHPVGMEVESSATAVAPPTASTGDQLLETEEMRKTREAQEARKAQQQLRKQQLEEKRRVREKKRQKKERKKRRNRILGKKQRVRRRYGRGSYLAEVLGQDVYYDVVVKTCKTLIYYDRYVEAADIIQDALTNVDYTDKANKVPFLRNLATIIAYYNDDFVSAFESVKFECARNPYDPQIWNLYNKMMAKAGSFTANYKFMTRLLLKHGTSIPLMVLVGHECFMSGSMSLALAEYFVAYNAKPNEPILSLCIGLAYLQLVMNRRLADRHYTTLRAFTFLFRYFELRKKNQEGCYNIGRAFHHLGLKHLAIPFYEKALEMSDNKDSPIPEEFDLKREIAYNLAHLYTQSGSDHLARRILAKYVTV